MQSVFLFLENLKIKRKHYFPDPNIFNTLLKSTENCIATPIFVIQCKNFEEKKVAYKNII